MSTLTASIASKARDFQPLSLPQSNALSSEKIYDSRVFDYLPHIKDVLKQAIFGIFIRIIQIPIRIVTLFAPVIQVKLMGENLREMTHENIDKGFFDPAKLPKDGKIPPKEKLHWMIDRINSFAKDLRVKQKIAIYSSENSKTYGAAAGSTLSCTAIPIILNRELLAESEDVIEAVLLHELTHVAHNHQGLDLLYTLAVMVADIAAAIFVTPFAIPLIEGLASPLNNFLHRALEKDADLTALKILNTNTGALKLFRKINQMNKDFRIADANEIKNHPEKFPLFAQLPSDEQAKRLQWRKMNLSPEGNNRKGLEHPPLTERIAYIKAFQPAAMQA